MPRASQATMHGWPDDNRGRTEASRETFRLNLARIMKERGVTQASLARTLDVSRVAVHAWIWGTCFPETSRLLTLAQVLNVPVGALLQENGAADLTPGTSSEESLLLDAFRTLPSTARLTLLAEAYDLSAQYTAKHEGNRRTAEAAS